MSRTIRKQSGNRWWRDLHRCNFNYEATEWFTYHSHDGWSWEISCNRKAKSWEQIDSEMKEYILNYEIKGKYNRHYKKALKWHSRKFIRQACRSELTKVMKDPEYEYNQEADTLVKKLIWVYD
ncbi:hypothetical protein CPT_Slocum_072 [Serratia phage Slocum]|nr:hypothetical protein CPT_Slocum_072 [Serratia phage Slocum]